MIETSCEGFREGVIWVEPEWERKKKDSVYLRKRQQVKENQIRKKDNSQYILTRGDDQVIVSQKSFENGAMWVEL